MSMYEQGGGQTAAGQTSDTTGALQERASDAAAQAKDKLQDAKEQAGEKIGEVQGQATSRARDEVDRRSTMAGEQVSGIADVARRMQDELSQEGKDPHAKVAGQVADNMDRLGGYLQRADADTLLRDIEDFGRRQPVALAAGGFVVGLLAARFLKASSSRRQSEWESRGWQGSGTYQTPAPAVGWDVVPATDPYATGPYATEPGRGGLELPRSTESAISGRGD